MKNIKNLRKETLIKIIEDLDFKLSKSLEQIGELQDYKDRSEEMILSMLVDLNSERYIRQELQRKFSEVRRSYRSYKNKADGLEMKLKQLEEERNEKYKNPTKIETTIRNFKEIKSDKTDIQVDDDLIPSRYQVKETYRHSKKSLKGNIKGTKHKGHKTDDEVLVGIFSDGKKRTFDSVLEAKDYIRKNNEKLKNSPLTNISRAARRTGSYKKNDGVAYGVKWYYETKEQA